MTDGGEGATIPGFSDGVQLNPTPRRSLQDRIRSAGLTSWAVIGIGIVVWAVVGYVFAAVAVLVAPVAIALVIVYLLNPLVTMLERRGVRRGLGVLIIWVLFLAVVTTAMAFLIPAIGRQISDLIERLPDYARQIIDEINAFAERRNIDLRISPDRATNLLRENQGTIFSVVSGVRAFAGQLLHVVLTVFIGLVLSIYLLIDMPKIQKSVVRLIPRDHRDEMLALGEKIGNALGGFFRGQLLVATFVGVASAVGLSLVKLPFAIVIGLIAGIFNLVPLIGPFIGAVPAVILGLLSDRPIRALWAMIVLLIVQQIDNHIISPNVMGRTVKLHPVTVMLSLIVGASIAGIPGMLLIIPLVATVKILAAHVWERRRSLGVSDDTAPTTSG